MNERRKAEGEYIRLHVRESNYLWQTACVSHHRGQESSGRRSKRVDEEKKGEEEERGDTAASRACQSLLSVAADKTNLSEYSSTSNAMHLKL